MHQMTLKIIDNTHQWTCADCGRIVSIGDTYTMINQGNPYTLHQTPSTIDTNPLLNLDFDTDIIPPEEKALFDKWESEFNDI